MSSDDYSPAPSGTFSRTPSIDPTKHVSYAPQPTAPSYPSLGTTKLTEPSQRSLPAPDQPLDISPVLSDIRPLLNSTNLITSGFSSRDPDPTRSSGTHAPGISGALHNNLSANTVTGVVGGEAKAPTMAGLAERDRSNNGESGEAEGESESESINPQDYVGISLVGKKFKLVNPKAYYVEKDDPYY